jgi:hypothetical protein
MISTSKYIFCVCFQVSPNILSLIINFVTSGEEQWKGYLYTILLVGSNLLRTLLNSQYFYTMQIMGLRIKSALSCFVFKKSMLLSPGARKVRTGNQSMHTVLNANFNKVQKNNTVHYFQWARPSTLCRLTPRDLWTLLRA